MYTQRCLVCTQNDALCIDRTMSCVYTQPFLISNNCIQTDRINNLKYPFIIISFLLNNFYLCKDHYPVYIVHPNII